MKLLAATVLAMAFATPALAHKEFIGKPVPVKPVVSACETQVEALQNQIIIMKKEMAALQSVQPSKKPVVSGQVHKPLPKPGQKPVDHQKKG